MQNKIIGRRISIMSSGLVYSLVAVYAGKSVIFRNMSGSSHSSGSLRLLGGNSGRGSGGQNPKSCMGSRGAQLLYIVP